MHSGFILFQSACHCWLCSSQKKKKQPFLEKMLLASLLLGVSFFSFFSCLCRVNLNNNNVALLTGKFSENVMARPLGAFADVAEKKKILRNVYDVMFLWLKSISPPNSVVNIFFSCDRNVSFAISVIHLDENYEISDTTGLLVEKTQFSQTFLCE